MSRLYEKAALKTKSTLPAREDIVELDIDIHKKELEENLKWRECPSQSQTVILAVIVDKWDAFNKGSMLGSIREGRNSQLISEQILQFAVSN